MTTQRTPYDAEFAHRTDATSRFQLAALREGYLRAKAEDAPLLEALKTVYDSTAVLNHLPTETQQWIGELISARPRRGPRHEGDYPTA